MVNPRTINTTIIGIRNKNKIYAIRINMILYEYKHDTTTLIDVEKFISLNKYKSLLEGQLTRGESKHTEHIWIKASQEKHSAKDKFIKIKPSLKLFC